MKEQQGLGVDVIINDIQSNPRCTHGPTILFERFQSDGTSKRYYACAACRDRRDCSFYHLADQKFSQAKEEVWQSYIKAATPKMAHKNIFNRLKEIKALPPADRSYCLTCCELFGTKQMKKHKSCLLKSPVTDIQLLNPSTLLPPKESSRFEAQYLFSPSAIEVLMGMLDQLKAKKVLCVGAPRIFEAINSSPKKKVSALLMDIDDRYRAFFSPNQYLQYNMFNHHFFGGEESKQVYKNFLSGNDKLVVVSDPPFGGRMELLGHNLLAIQNEWRTTNKLTQDEQLSVLFIFPYFMEPQVLENLPSFTMLDYQVDYDNHPLYSSGTMGMINGSAVRIYVNDSPSLFPLPDGKGYKHCEICNRWVRSTNMHCEKCNGCMSKDGRTYKHCDDCEKCVKPSWIHCTNCHKCLPQDHKCDGTTDGASKTFTCHICGEVGHKRMDCPKRKRSLSQPDSHQKNKKRKSENTGKKEMQASSESFGKENQNKKIAGKKNMKNKGKNLSTEATKNGNLQFEKENDFGKNKVNKKKKFQKQTTPEKMQFKGKMKSPMNPTTKPKKKKNKNK